MTKQARHLKILELISEHRVETQEELCSLLNSDGIQVTQATVSRDIRELNLTKQPEPDGVLRYAALPDGRALPDMRLIRVFQDAVVSVTCADNLIVIKTLPGMAMAVGSSVDAMGFSDILGTIAGDDTLFCAVRTGKKASFIAARMLEIKAGE